MTTLGAANRSGTTGSRTDGLLMSTSARRDPGDRPRRHPLVPTEVVRDARRGDHAAVGRLGTEVFRRVLAFYRYAGLADAQAEDLAAEALETVIARLSRLRDATAFDSWVWAIARTKLRGWIRTHRRPIRVQPMSAVPPGPAEQAILGEEHAAIRAALLRLGPRDRELLWLREVEGLTYAEIGGRLGAAVGTVRVACLRARRRLERAFDEVGGPGVEG